MTSKEDKSHELVLVTGAGGFIAMHVIAKFLREGYRVRGTVRQLRDPGKIDSLRRLEPSEDKLELVQADLLDAESWSAVMRNVTLVMHVASPFPSQQPADESSIIEPALQGTLNVLRAAFENNKTVRRVVVTSSTIAIFGQFREPRMYTEQDWPDLSKITYAYAKSKILAEKAAWDFVEEKKRNGEMCFELSVINPSFVMGPSLHGQSVILGTSESRIKSYLEGSIDEIPRVNMPICDVRDVADAHFIAAFAPEAVNHRHAIVSQRELISMISVADILHGEFHAKGYTRIPRRESVSEGVYAQSTIDDSRMRNVLGINPIPLRKTVIDMANSLIDNGLIKLDS